MLDNFTVEDRKSISIRCEDGKSIVAQLYGYNDQNPEISICLHDKDGVVIQDLCLLRRNEPGKTQCLVWDDENDEDYTHDYQISDYVENEQERGSK